MVPAVLMQYNRRFLELWNGSWGPKTAKVKSSAQEPGLGQSSSLRLANFQTCFSKVSGLKRNIQRCFSLAKVIYAKKNQHLTDGVLLHNTRKPQHNQLQFVWHCLINWTLSSCQSFSLLPSITHDVSVELFSRFEVTLWDKISFE